MSVSKVVFNNTKNKIVIGFDPGHGGWKNGYYQIRKKGSKQYKHTEFTFYEGVFNRELTDETIEYIEQHACDLNYVDLRDIYGDKELDYSLPYRCQKINELYRELKKKGYSLVVESIHGNAGKGTGIEVWTSPGQTGSDPIAEQYCREYISEFGKDWKFRPDKASDGDLDKESRFYILVNTACRIVLTENGFFDRLSDAKKMNDPKWRKRLIKARVKAMQSIV